MSQAANLSAMMSGTTLTVPNLTYTGTSTGVNENLSGNLTANNIVSSNNVTYSGTLTGGTGVINIGSGQIYKDGSGNLLVGTTTLATGFSSYAQIEASATTGGVLINSANNQIGRLMFTNNNASGAEGLIRYDGSNKSMQFWTNALEVGRFDSSGNLGLGVTPSGTYKLEVSGTGKFTNYVSFNDQGYIRSSSGTLDFQGGTSGMRFMKYDYATQQMTLDASGNLLVGATTATGARQTVASAGPATTVIVNTNKLYTMLGKLISSNSNATAATLFSMAVGGSNATYAIKVVARGAAATQTLAWEDTFYAYWRASTGGYVASGVSSATVVNIVGTHTSGTLSWLTPSTAPSLQYTQGNNGYITESIDVYVTVRDGATTFTFNTTEQAFG